MQDASYHYKHQRQEVTSTPPTHLRQKNGS